MVELRLNLTGPKGKVSIPNNCNDRIISLESKGRLTICDQRITGGVADWLGNGKVQVVCVHVCLIYPAAAPMGEVSELSIKSTILNSLKGNEIIWIRSPLVTHFDR